MKAKVLPREISRILLIEDDPDHAELVVQALQSHHGRIKVEKAGTGVEGMACVVRGAYDLAILDYQLPDGDGLFWLERLREDVSSHRVKMTTAIANCRV